jgi:hypothetical protein
MPIKKSFWISYDLGLKGNYSDLYAWLDTLGAKECGDSVAYFTKQYTGNFIEAIKKDILKHVKPSKTDRIYLIYLENETGRIKGHFLFGGRKRAPWEGYAVSTHEGDEDFS